MEAGTNRVRAKERLTPFFHEFNAACRRQEKR